MSFSATKTALHSLCQRCVGSRRPPALRLAFWLIFTVFGFSQAHAEILIDARVGFHGVFQLGHPFPLEVELSNTGRPVEGALEVQVWKGGATKGGAPYRANYRRQLFLGGQARKSVQLTVDPDFISRPLTVRFIAADVTAVREIDLRRYFSPAPVRLLLSESGVLPPVTFTSPAAQSRLVSLAPAELSADARAFLGISHLILYDQSLRDLSRAQLLALDTWLTAGGRLVIVGSLNYALYQEPALARFLPVRVTGTKQIVFTPGRGKDKKSVSLPGVWAQTSKLLRGKVLAQSDGIPLLVEATRGRGRITYLALDIGRPPLSRWEGLAQFLQGLITPPDAEEPAPRTEWSDAVFNQLIASPKFISTYIPSAGLLSAMVVYLGGIGTIGWLWQRKRMAPGRLLAALIAVITAAAAAGYVHFSHGGNIPDGVLLVSTVLENSGDGFVDAQGNLALFSTQLRQYDLRLERGWTELTPVTSRAHDGAEPAVITQDSGGASRYRLPLREWDYRLFRMRRVDRFPFSAEFEAQGDKLVMRVDNRSAKDLTNCWLLVPGQRFDLGLIPRGTSWRREFALGNGKAAPEASNGAGETLNWREVTFADKTRDILFHSSMFPRDGDARWASGSAVFFGWVKDPEAHVHVDDARIQTQGYALFRAVYPLGGEEEE
ncbi:MAG: hypothetical protein ACM3SP_08230 [Chloroflexota bacterium]